MTDGQSLFENQPRTSAAHGTSSVTTGGYDLEFLTRRLRRVRACQVLRSRRECSQQEKRKPVDRGESDQEDSKFISSQRIEKLKAVRGKEFDSGTSETSPQNPHDQSVFVIKLTD